jgi:hypothetical protein
MTSTFGSLDVTTLDAPSLLLLNALEASPVSTHARAAMKCYPGDACSLVIEIRSPTGDPRRDVSLWLTDDRDPSLEFGGWHTHASLWATTLADGVAEMVGYLERIVAGEIVLEELPTVGEGMPYCVLDLKDAEACLESATLPGRPNGMTLLSWSGSQDLTLEDLAQRSA